MVGLLKGRALDWASAVRESQPALCDSCSQFTTEMKVFDHPVQGRDAANRLTQAGVRSAAEFSVEFRTVAAESGWNAEALLGVFLKGLSDQLKDELAARDDSTSLDALITLAIRIDNRLCERRRERASSHLSTPASLPSPQSSTSHSPAHAPASCAIPTSHAHSSLEEEPMQLGQTRLSPAERLWRMQTGECVYCGHKRHFLSSCPR